VKGRTIVLVVTSAMILVGCESAGPRDVGTFRGRTVRGEDGAGYGPVTVGLLHVADLTWFGHVQTDSSGGFEFEDVPPGSYVPVVTDNTRELFHLNEASYAMRAGRIVQLELVMVPNYGALYDFGLVLRGEVTDAETGEPVENAVVETTHFDETNQSLFSEIHGSSDTVTQLTGPDGRFLLWPLAKLVLNPDDIGRVPHVRIYKPGYRSAYAGGWRTNQVPHRLRVALQPGADLNLVTGRLRTLAGEPVANLGVALEWRRAVDSLKEDPATGKILMPRLVGWSDDDGIFRIEGVPDGGFVLDPSFLRDDGWVGQQGVVVDVGPSQREADAGDLVVSPAFAPEFPLDGAQLTAQQLRFDWPEVEGAMVYQIDFRRRSDGGWLTVNTENLFLDPDPGVFSVATDYTWLLKAFASLNPIVEITRFERPQEFTVTEGSDVAASSPWK
jgi:hypothetical protein